MRRQSVILAGALLLACSGAARAELVLEPGSEAVTQEYYSQPSVPSIVFVSPEAREAGAAWLPAGAPFIPRPPLLLSIQQQPYSPVFLNRPAPLGGVIPHPPNSVMAAASLNAAHGYKFGAAANPCATDTMLSYRIGLGIYYPFGTNCWFNPYAPMLGGPPGLNRPTDRLPNSAAAARAVDRAHSYKFGQ
jgi:hypothetical protein